MKVLKKYLISLLMISLFLEPVFSREGGNFGDQAPEFPAGEFSNSVQYRLSDFRGQLIVLFFYEQKCPRCRSTIRDRNKIVNKFKDKPVMFFAVGAGDSLEEVRAYANDTHLAMPVFADSKSKMEKAYGFRISLSNIYQVRVIGPSGQIIAYDMKPETIEECLSALNSKSNGKANLTPEANTANNEFTAVPKGKGASSKDPAVLNNEAVKAINSNDFKTAIEALTALLKIRPGYKIAQENLQIAYTNCGCQFANEQKFEEAAPMMKEAYELAEKLFDAKDARYCSALENYAGILTQLGRNLEADELRKRLTQSK